MGKRANSDNSKARLIDTPQNVFPGDLGADQAPAEATAAAGPANDQAAPPSDPKPATAAKVRARLLGDTAGTGRNLPFGLNGQIIEVSPEQLAANSDMLRAV